MDITPEFKEMFEKMWPEALDKVKALAEGKAKPVITLTTDVNAPVTKAWKHFNDANEVTKWNHASDDWHCPSAMNDLREGGKFSYTMAAKDGSYSFDLVGVYTAVEENKHIAYTMGDGRTVDVRFEEKDGKTHITESFEAENTNSLDMQRGGWQSILDNYKKHTENN